MEVQNRGSLLRTITFRFHFSGQKIGWCPHLLFGLGSRLLFIFNNQLQRTTVLRYEKTANRLYKVKDNDNNNDDGDTWICSTVSSLQQDATVAESEASTGQISLVTSHQNIFLYFSYVSGCKIPISMANGKDNKMEKHRDTEQKVEKRIIFVFGVIGFLVDFFFSIYQSAAQDIFEATNIPTPWITLSIAAPACLVTFIYPCVFQRVPVSVACFVLFIASVAEILLTSLAKDLRVRLSGVCLVSFGIGSMEAVSCWSNIIEIYWFQKINEMLLFLFKQEAIELVSRHNHQNRNRRSIEYWIFSKWTTINPSLGSIPQVCFLPTYTENVFSHLPHAHA